MSSSVNRVVGLGFILPHNLSSFYHVQMLQDYSLINQ
jgi:hypothetical protein